MMNSSIFNILSTAISIKKGEMTLLEMDQVSLLGTDFARTLTSYQLKALRHLIAIRNGANFSIPGSGKTTVALGYYQHLKSTSIVDRLLVIGPASCFEPWEHEFTQCFQRLPQSVRVAGNPRNVRKELLLTSSRFELILTTYHSAANDITEMARALSTCKCLLVLDESHYIKRPQGGKLAAMVLQLAPLAKRRLILTGTPMPNGLADLWSQVTFLWPNRRILDEVETYLAEISSQDQNSAVNRVKKKIYPLFYRTTKSQLGLPPVKFETVLIRLSPLQERIYRGVASRFLALVEEAPSEINALREWRSARAIRLLQIATNPGLLRTWSNEFRLPKLSLEGISLSQAIDHYTEFEIPNKILRTIEIARDLVNQKRKVLIWSTFVHNLKMIATLLSDLGTVVVHGAVPVSSDDENEFSREQLIARFKTNPNCMIMIANPAACAESISLHQVCHDAIYVDRTFNCAHYLQSLDRIHRLGLNKEAVTTYYLLQSEGTIDGIIHQRLEEKSRLMNEVVEGELPVGMQGYWAPEIGGIEDTDLSIVEDHIRTFVKDIISGSSS